MEVAQIFPLLVLENAEEVAGLHLELCAETFGHERHELLEVAKLAHSLNDLGVLYTLEIFL